MRGLPLSGRSRANLGLRRSRVAYFENGRFIPVSAVPGGYVHSIAGDGAGNLWISRPGSGSFSFASGGVSSNRSPGPGWDARTSPTLCSPILSRAACGLDFYQGGVAYFKDGQVRASYASADGLGEGRVDRPSTRSGRYALGRNRGRAEPGERRPRCHAYQQERIALRCGSLGDGRRRPFVLAVHGLRPGAHCPARAGRVGRRFEADDPDHGFRQFRRSQEPCDAASGYSPRVAKSADGKLWFVPCDGVSVIDPRHLPFNKLPPPVHIEQITADRKTYETSSNLRLPPLIRDLEIDYTALSLVAPEKIRFRVKLEGCDRDWKDVGNERKAFYNNLPPRNYRFRVMASNNSGVWNEAGASFDFSIAPAYYQTRWFQASCVAAFLALLWGAVSVPAPSDRAGHSTCAWKSGSASGRASPAICMTRCCRVFRD